MAIQMEAGHDGRELGVFFGDAVTRAELLDQSGPARLLAPE